MEHFTPAQFEVAQRVFPAVRSLPRSAWAAHIQRGCAGDASVERAVARMLEHDSGDDDAGTRLRSPFCNGLGCDGAHE